MRRRWPGDPAIHVFARRDCDDVDARALAGHDDDQRPESPDSPHGRQRRHPVQPRLPAEARRRRRSPPRRAAGALQQSEPVHLHRHGQLHRGQGQGRDHRSRPRRRGACQGAAGRRARRDRDAYPGHPYPSRPLAEHRADQGRHRRAGLCRGAASRLAAALREREAQSGIRRRPRLQARHRSQERRHHRRSRAGRWKRWRRRATPPTIWRSPGPSERSISSAIT